MRYPHLIVSTAHAEGYICCPAQRRPVRHKPREGRIGYVRTPAAVAAKRLGGHVGIERSCVAKAQVMLASLREHRFIDL